MKSALWCLYPRRSITAFRPRRACCYTALRGDCIAFDVNLGCSGFVYGLSIVASMMRTSLHTMVLASVFDYGSLLEIQREFARSIVVGFAALGGATVGVVASQPMHMAGVLDCDSSDKAAHFVRFCDAFSIPLVTFADVPGYLPGAHQEKAEQYRNETMNTRLSFARGYVNEVIDQVQTRAKLIACLSLRPRKKARLQRKKHGNIPL